MSKAMRHLLILIFLFNALRVFAQVNTKKEFRFAEKQTAYMLRQLAGTAAEQGKAFPRTFESGKLKLVTSGDWTSGFFPGVLWYLYEFTQDTHWAQQARSFTAKLEKEQYNKTTHDLGFIMNCSFGNAYRLSGDSAYRKIILQSARSLASRFNPITQTIRSWDHNHHKWQYPVIIDNMMNLELLFSASKLSGDSTFRHIAIRHANATLENHFRPDFSSYHVVDYDAQTGRVIKRTTHQGFSDESSWARGQAWALYGFTMCYRETGMPGYLEQAKNIASFILQHPRLPSDLVPFWDFDDPAIPNTSRDASAAAIIASALYELYSYEKNPMYLSKAEILVNSLSQSYRLPFKSSGGFILEHSTGNRPAGSEIDTPLNYADYYYLEALLRRESILKN